MDSIEEIRRQRAIEWEMRMSVECVPIRGRSRSPRGKVVSDVACDELRVLSWNIDGLDDLSSEEDMLGRTLWVIEKISQVCPHVIFFQELIDFNYHILNQRLNRAFHFIKQEDASLPYFVAILIHRKTMKLNDSRTISFPSSRMGRSAVYAAASFIGSSSPPIGFITAHLESLGESSSERKNQLEICKNFIHKSIGIDKFVFGGDLNIRDIELGAFMQGGQFKDCWTHVGSPKENQYTWDMARNDNPQMKGKPCCRFDRLYMWSRCGEFFSVKKFNLVGTDRIPSLNRFASDHFGIFVEFTGLWN